jgi:hypothetical protein
MEWILPEGTLAPTGVFTPFVIALVIACGVAPLWYFR